MGSATTRSSLSSNSGNKLVSSLLRFVDGGSRGARSHLLAWLFIQKRNLIDGLGGRLRRISCTNASELGGAYIVMGHSRRESSGETASTGSSIVDGFSLIEGGPIWKLQMLAGLGLPEPRIVLKRALLAVIVTWVPLLLLSLFDGQAFSARVRIPFFYDFAVNVRFLITLPLLIAAEIVIDRRLKYAVKHFVASGLVTPEELPAFERVIGKMLVVGGRDLFKITSIATAAIC